MSVQNIFSTPIKIISLENYEEINIICGKASKIGFKRNFFDNLNEDEKIKTRDLFNKESKIYYKESIGQELDVFITKSWFSYHQKYNWNTPHGHGDNAFVGVYYIKTNDNSGDLLLHDPRGTVTFTHFFDEDSKKETVGCRSYIKIKPKVGDLVLFPSYIVHSVEPNMSDETRISLALNFKYKDFNDFKPE